MSSEPLFQSGQDGQDWIPRAATRGRGATPRAASAVLGDVSRYAETFRVQDTHDGFVSTFARPNPAQRRQLTFRFRPLQSWSAQEIRAACLAVMRWFAGVGGLRIADDAVLRLTIDAMRDPERVQEEHALQVEPGSLLRWAIDEKARSLKPTAEQDLRFKRTFTGSYETFIAKHLDYWIDRAPETIAARQRHDARKHDEITAARYLETEQRLKAAQSVAEVQAAGDAHRDARQRHETAQAAIRRMWYGQLSEERRALVLREITAERGEEMQDPRHDQFIREECEDHAAELWPGDLLRYEQQPQIQALFFRAAGAKPDPGPLERIIARAGKPPEAQS